MTNRLTALLSDVTIGAITAAGGNLLLHAGAVARADRADRATAVLCGASGSGKSTLTAGLVTAGVNDLRDPPTGPGPG